MSSKLVYSVVIVMIILTFDSILHSIFVFMNQLFIYLLKFKVKNKKQKAGHVFFCYLNHIFSLKLEILTEIENAYNKEHGSAILLCIMLKQWYLKIHRQIHSKRLIILK